MLIDFLLADGMRPFTTAYLAVVGLLLLELALMAIGLSSAINGSEIDGGGIDGGGIDGSEIASVDTDAPGAGMIDHGFVGISDGAADLDHPVGADHADGLPAADLSGANVDTRHITVRKSGLIGWLGLSDVPLMVWLAILATSFGSIGYLMQWTVSGVTGHLLPASVAAILALIPAIAVSRRLSRTFGRLVPRIETSAISERSYGRRVGVVTTGVARRGYPAEVRFTDGFGTQHYTLAEPLDAADEIPAGAEVAIMKLRSGELRIVRTDA